MRRDLPDDGKVVADEEDRDARLALKIDQQVDDLRLDRHVESGHRLVAYQQVRFGYHRARDGDALRLSAGKFGRSEEHTSELQSLMRISYAVFCLKKKNTNTTQRPHNQTDTFTP